MKNPFPDFHDFPFDPFTGGVPDRESERRFSAAMEPFWNSTRAMLLRLKPQGWVGFRCDVEVRREAATGKYLVDVCFCDGVTNRSKAVTSTAFLEGIGCLHEAYRLFDSHLEWKRVRISQVQEAGSTRWENRLKMVYGRAVLEAGSGEGGKLGDS